MNRPATEVPPPAVSAHGWWDGKLWSLWVLANALGEFVGLGTAALLGVFLVMIVEGWLDTSAPLIIAVGMVSLGTFEGAVVGGAQWLVLRQRLSEIAARTWTGATALGAFIAWTLGMVPSSLIEFGGNNGNASGPDFSPVIYYGLASALGAVLGVVLAVPQWVVLRRHVTHAGWWLPANSVAWAIAMPVVFLGASSGPGEGLSMLLVILIAGTVIVAGAVVGAVHGVAMLRLTTPARDGEQQSASSENGQSR
jgi:hypothetical protein